MQATPTGRAELTAARACHAMQELYSADDLEYFLSAPKAAKAFEVLDVDGDGKVSLHDIRDAVLNVYRVSCWLQPAHQAWCSRLA